MSAPPVMIGLEVHAYVATQAKMFCACPNRFWSPDAEPNTLLCPVCTSQPGAKPMAPNRAALVQGFRVARTLGCTLSDGGARFLRKHYFYPDLPSNYQRTSEPFCTGGKLLGTRLREIHWEEDPGAYDPKAGVVDFNRSGAPLLEIVTEPDLRTPASARELLDELRLALSYLGVLSPAGMKSDANISLAGGERVEVKNLNSARNVEDALAHEMERQAALLADGKPIARETRHYDETFQRTLPLRAKESEADYRLVPDPDLPLVDLAAARAGAEASLPPDPFALRASWIRDLGVTKEGADVLLGEPRMPQAFGALAQRLGPRRVFDFLVGDLKRELNYRGLGYAASGIALEELEGLLRARQDEGLPRPRATELLRLRLDQGSEAFQTALQGERRAKATADEVAEAVREAIAGNLHAVEDYRKGNPKALNRLIGDAMKVLRGRADAADVGARLQAALGEPPPR